MKHICAYTTFICVCVCVCVYIPSSDITQCHFCCIPFIEAIKFMFGLKEWGNCFRNIVCIKILFSWTFFLIAWSVLCCSWAFSSQREWGYSSLWCAGFSLRWLLLLKSMGSRAWASVVVHGLNCPTVGRIFLDQGSKLCLQNWQADFYPLRHQGSPWTI